MTSGRSAATLTVEACERKVVPTVACECCGGVVAVGTSGKPKKYCSAACRQRAYRGRQRGTTVVPRIQLSPLDRFVGRDAEFTAVMELLRHERRLVTLTGPPGVGKSRLALEVATALNREYPSGMCLVDLGTLSSPEEILPAVAASLGAEAEPDSLLPALHGRRLLLVLDNCEHLVEAAGALAVSVLQACEGPQVLATSRETLRRAGETVYPLDVLPGADAAELFADRAASAAPGFKATPVVDEICARLDHLPLAVELAARRARLLPLEDIRDRAEDRFTLLTGHDPADRRGDLHAAVEWSYRLLDEDEQAMFRRLAVLPGGFDLAMARAVTSDLDLPVLRLVAALESKSLLVADVNSGRFHMLESVREFAAELLTDRDEAVELLAARLTELATPLLSQLTWRRASIEAIDAEYGNLPVALDHLQARGDPRELLLRTALRGCERRRGRIPTPAETLAALERHPGAPTAYRVSTLKDASWLCASQNDHERALALARQAVEEASDESPVLYVRALMALSNAHQLTGDVAAACAALEQAHAALPDAADDSLCCQNLAWALLQAGDVERAASVLSELDDRNLTGYELSLRVALHHTSGAVRLAQNDTQAALSHFVKALRISAAAPTVHTPAVLEGLAVVAQRCGDEERAGRLVATAAVWRAGIGAETEPWWAEKVRSEVRREAASVPVDEVIAYATAVAELPADDSVAAIRLAGTPLTSRERDVATLVAEGHSNGEIAVRLGVAERTVVSHLENIARKLRLRSRTQLAAWVARTRTSAASLTHRDE